MLARAYELPPGWGSGYGPGVGTIAIYTKDSIGYRIAGSLVTVTNLHDITVSGYTDAWGSVIFRDLPTGSYDCYVQPPPGWLTPPDIFPNVVESVEPTFEIRLTPNLDQLLLPPTGIGDVPVLAPVSSSSPGGGSWFSGVGQFVADRAGNVVGTVTDAAGTVRDAAGSAVGYVANHAGQVKDAIGNVVGDVAGTYASILLPPPFAEIVSILVGRNVVSQLNDIIGTVTQDGTVRNVAGAIVGAIVNPAGEVADAIGNVIGHVVPEIGVPAGTVPGGSGTVTMTVQSKRTGQPIAGATVSVANVSRTTDASGHVIVTGLTDGSTTTYAVRAQGYQSTSGTVTVPAVVTVQLLPVAAPGGADVGAIVLLGGLGLLAAGLLRGR